jgi:hypothetical protein
LSLKCEKLHSSFALNFNSRRYSKAQEKEADQMLLLESGSGEEGLGAGGEPGTPAGAEAGAGAGAELGGHALRL